MPGFDQAIRFIGVEWFFHILIRHQPPSNSCVPGVGTRNRCVFRLMSMPSPRSGKGVPAGESGRFLTIIMFASVDSMREPWRSTHSTLTSPAEFENASVLSDRIHLESTDFDLVGPT